MAWHSQVKSWLDVTAQTRISLSGHENQSNFRETDIAQIFYTWAISVATCAGPHNQAAVSVLKVTGEIAMKIKVTSIYVDDQGKALRFYTDVLGFVKKMDVK